jgi:hypothetical protein
MNAMRKNFADKYIKNLKRNIIITIVYFKITHLSDVHGERHGMWRVTHRWVEPETKKKIQKKNIILIFSKRTSHFAEK